MDKPHYGYAGPGPAGSGDRRPGSPVVAVVGAGAAGTLTAIHRGGAAVRRRGPADPPAAGRLTPIGGSLAQREVVEDTYLYALVVAGRCEEAVALIDARLDRRPSPLDLRRRRTAAARAIA